MYALKQAEVAYLGPTDMACIASSLVLSDGNRRHIRVGIEV
jgi:hypothetical protein